MVALMVSELAMLDWFNWANESMICLGTEQKQT